MVNTLRFACPSASLGLSSLLSRTRRTLWICLIGAVAIHSGASQLKGLGAKQASRLVSRWKANQPGGDKASMNPIAKKYISQVNTLYTAEVFGDTDDIDTANRKLAFMAQIEAYIEQEGSSLTEQKMFDFWSKQLSYATGEGFWVPKPSAREILGIADETD